MTTNKPDQNTKELPVPRWIGDLIGMSNILLDDVQRVSNEIAKAETDQYLRRTFIRSLFAMIEGNFDMLQFLYPTGMRDEAG